MNVVGIDHTMCIQPWVQSPFVMEIRQVPKVRCSRLGVQPLISRMLSLVNAELVRLVNSTRRK